MMARTTASLMVLLILQSTVSSQAPPDAAGQPPAENPAPAGQKMPADGEQAVVGEILMIPDDGKNLVGDQLRVSATTSSLSPRVQLVQAMIDGTIQLETERGTLLQSLVQREEQIRTMELTKKALPDKIDAAIGNVAQAELKLEQLGPALRFGRNNPQARQYFLVKQAQVGFVGEVNDLRSQHQKLPFEITNLKNKQKGVLNALGRANRKAVASAQGWSNTLGYLEFVSLADAEAISQMVRINVQQYPEFVPLNAMLGFAELHCSRPKSSLEWFDKVLAARSMPDGPVALLKERSTMGKIWAYLELKQLDDAGALISETQNVIRRSRVRNPKAIYELNLCEARLWELRDRPDDAYRAYTRAIKANKNSPAAYRLVAVLTAKTGVRPPETALIAAERACKVDETNDFRNHVALAHAHQALEQDVERDRAMDDARKYAKGMNAPDELVESLLAAVTQVSAEATE